MRTTFTFDDDKQLVQLAQGYIDSGTRIPWNDVARRMRSTKHSAAALRQRLQALYRTWGREIGRFPANFFTPVRRPRGRPPAVTQELRNIPSSSARRRPPPPEDAATPPESFTGPRPRPKSDAGTGAAREAARAVAAEPSQESRAAAPAAILPRPPEAAVTRAARAAARNVAASRLEARPTSVTPGRRPTEAGTAPPTLQLPIPSIRGANMATAVLPVQPVPVLCSSDAEKAVTAIFAGVPRAAVDYTGGSSHLNVGEVLPPGVTTLLQELGDISGHDIFFDIGAGLGNVVVQVVLATNVSKAIGIEVRDDVQNVGVDMIARSPHARRIDERVEFICKDITGLPFSRVEPYVQATIVFWNNVLFESVTTEFVKRELGGLPRARLVICTAPMCPRHREPCFAAFCSSFELFKEAGIACSWKAEPQRAYFYRSFPSY